MVFLGKSKKTTGVFVSRSLVYPSGCQEMNPSDIVAGLCVLAVNFADLS